MTKKMTKKLKKVDWRIYLGGVIALLVLSMVVVNAQGVSVLDRIYNKAGETLGKLIYGKMEGQIDLTEPEPVSFGGTLSEKWVKQGNLVTYIESGNFYDASTTLVSFVNPFGVPTSTDARWNDENWGIVGTDATSTVISVSLDIPVSGVATSTIVINCGASADAYSVPTYGLFTLILPTSTPGVFENNLATTTGGFNAIGGGSVDKILLTHDYSYFTCNATGTPDAEAVWGDNYDTALLSNENTFNGTWSVEIRKNLQ